MLISLTLAGIDTQRLLVTGAGNPVPESLMVLADSVASFRIMAVVSKPAEARVPVEVHVRNTHGQEHAVEETIFMSGGL